MLFFGHPSRDPKNPDKKEKIFGYNLVLSTSVELQLKLELPVAVTNIAGNADEGSQIITNKEQLHDHQRCQTKIDIADANMTSFLTTTISGIEALFPSSTIT